MTELRRELEDCIKQYNEIKVEEKAKVSMKRCRFSASQLGYSSLIIMICLGLIIFGGLYPMYGERLKTLVICLCTIVPVLVLTTMFVLVFCVKKKIEEPKPDEDPAIVTEIDEFSKRFETSLIQFAHSFRIQRERGQSKTLFFRLFILIETLSLVKTIMVNVPHLLAEDRLKHLSNAFDALEQSLNIDSKDIFTGVNDETDDVVNMQNMDLLFKIGMPLFYLGSPSLYDNLEIEEENKQIADDTH